MIASSLYLRLRLNVCLLLTIPYVVLSAHINDTTTSRTTAGSIPIASITERPGSTPSSLSSSAQAQLHTTTSNQSGYAFLNNQTFRTYCPRGDQECHSTCMNFVSQCNSAWKVYSDAVASVYPPSYAPYTTATNIATNVLTSYLLSTSTYTTVVSGYSNSISTATGTFQEDGKWWTTTVSVNECSRCSLWLILSADIYHVQSCCDGDRVVYLRNQYRAGLHDPKQH